METRKTVRSGPPIPVPLIACCWDVDYPRTTVDICGELGPSLFRLLMGCGELGPGLFRLLMGCGELGPGLFRLLMGCGEESWALACSDC